MAFTAVSSEPLKPLSERKLLTTPSLLYGRWLSLWPFYCPSPRGSDGAALCGGRWRQGGASLPSLRGRGRGRGRALDSLATPGEAPGRHLLDRGWSPCPRLQGRLPGPHVAPSRKVTLPALASLCCLRARHCGRRFGPILLILITSWAYQVPALNSGKGTRKDSLEIRS